MTTRPISVAIDPIGRLPWLEPLLADSGLRVVSASAPHDVRVVSVDAGAFPDAVEWMGRRHGEAPGRAVPIVAACADMDLAARMMAAGADDFVLEGVGRDELALRIRSMAAAKGAFRSEAARESERKALLDLATRYASALDVTAVLKDLALGLADHLAIGRCALILVERNEGTGHVVASSDDLEISDLRIDLSRYPEIQEAMRSRRPVVIDDVRGHPLLDSVRGEVADAGVGAVAAIPLDIQDQVLGVMLLRAGDGPFRDDDVDFAWTLARATAIAVRNARTIDVLKGEARTAREQAGQMALYRDFFRLSADGIAQVDSEGKVVAMNAAGAAILGVDSADVVGRPVTDLVCPGSRDELERMVRWARQGRPCGNSDVEAAAAGGRTMSLWVCCSAVMGGMSFVSFRDITAAKAGERSLRKSSEFMEKLIDTTEESVVAVGACGDVILFNKGASLALANGGDMAERRLETLFCDAVATQVRALFALNPKPEDESGTIRIPRTDALDAHGTPIPVQLTASLVHDGDDVLAAVIIFRDLREQSRLEEELKQAEAQLAEAQRQAMVMELAGAAAHQLNQPLTCIIGYTDLLLKRVARDDGNRMFIERILHEGERMAELVRKIGKITVYATREYVGDRRIIDLDRASIDAAPGEGGTDPASSPETPPRRS